MAKIIKLYQKIDTVKEALNEAVSENYDSVIIIGIKDDNLKVRWSKLDDQFKIAGCLEIAKMDILK